jgi:hypothetical protein
VGGHQDLPAGGHNIARCRVGHVSAKIGVLRTMFALEQAKRE